MAKRKRYKESKKSTELSLLFWTAVISCLTGVINLIDTIIETLGNLS